MFVSLFVDRPVYSGIVADWVVVTRSLLQLELVFSQLHDLRCEYIVTLFHSIIEYFLFYFRRSEEQSF